MDPHTQQPGQADATQADDPGMAPESGEHGGAQDAGTGSSGASGADASGDDAASAPESGDR
ncbi:MAG TPA: hypothetical protein VF143_10500 [Candidatus Nanopelagicales bacterium]